MRTPSLPVLAAVAIAALALAATRLAPTAAAERAEPAGDVRCRIFAVPLDTPWTLDTSDGTSEIGQWVASEKARGAAVVSTDFETAQRVSGYPTGYVQVCVGAP